LKLTGIESDSGILLLKSNIKQLASAVIASLQNFAYVENTWGDLGGLGLLDDNFGVLTLFDNCARRFEEMSEYHDSDLSGNAAQAWWCHLAVPSGWSIG
jgi:hypothetical protein